MAVSYSHVQVVSLLFVSLLLTLESIAWLYCARSYHTVRKLKSAYTEYITHVNYGTNSTILVSGINMNYAIAVCGLICAIYTFLVRKSPIHKTGMLFKPLFYFIYFIYFRAAFGQCCGQTCFNPLSSGQPS